ncbi:hypothetical protein E2C01_075346 [Portunus trituberculatus]|uniref:Uncharacterized protein n=1 Tax=Portunus trituberculatus TaxID=210409 RepID=A0A5B7IIW9_PORTR|nr:hypothetical protein [Portunus trituberculatus]
MRRVPRRPQTDQTTSLFLALQTSSHHVPFKSACPPSSSSHA